MRKDLKIDRGKDAARKSWVLKQLARVFPEQLFNCLREWSQWLFFHLTPLKNRHRSLAWIFYPHVTFHSLKTFVSAAVPLLLTQQLRFWPVLAGREDVSPKMCASQPPGVSCRHLIKTPKLNRSVRGQRVDAGLIKPRPDGQQSGVLHVYKIGIARPRAFVTTIVTFDRKSRTWKGGSDKSHQVFQSCTEERGSH